MWRDEKGVRITRCLFYLGCLLVIGGVDSVFAAHAQEISELKLASNPFSSSMCKKLGKDSYIRLRIAHHRDLVLRTVPGQHVPRNSDEARKKNYVHFVTVADLTNGRIQRGAIAFDQRHAIIFEGDQTQGISRAKFLAQFSPDERSTVTVALNTFLRLHALFNAAVDACRSYPPRITYDTDDEIDRIEIGKLTFTRLVKQFNAHPYPRGPLYHYESGQSEGFVDPDAGKHSNISYQAMNPLNFYVPSGYP